MFKRKAEGSTVRGWQPPTSIDLVQPDHNNRVHNCRCDSFDLDLQIYVATAFAQVTAVFTTSKKGDAIVRIPLQSSQSIVTHMRAIGPNGLAFETVVIPSDDQQELIDSAGKLKFSDETVDFFADTPSGARVVQIPLVKLPRHSQITIEVSYHEAITFDPSTGRYAIEVPLRFSNAKDVQLSVRGTVHTGYPDCRVVCESHPDDLEISPDSDTRMRFQSGGTDHWDLKRNLRIHYDVWGMHILPTMVVKENAKAGTGEFGLFVAPPAANNITEYFPRGVIFLLDKSLSMTGNALDRAKEALLVGLESLRPSDWFGVIAYDHEQAWFVPQEAVADGTVPEKLKQHMYPASEALLEEARKWIEGVQTHGLTDILTPLQMATDQLASNPHIAVPFVFLITDGAVKNEREICHWAATSTRTPKVRISTFGIGTYCNTYFLRELARAGSGFFDVAVVSREITQRMTLLLRQAAVPVLTDVAVELVGATSCELYPFPIPDLFCGRPLVIAGRYSGTLARDSGGVQVRGRLPNGEVMMLAVDVVEEQLPLERMFVQQQLDLMVANAWFTESEDDKQKCIDVSCEHGVVCPFTTMIAVKTTETKLHEEDEKRKKLEDGDIDEDESTDDFKQRRHAAQNKALVATIATGGVLAVGMSAVLIAGGFGSVADTVANAAGGMFEGIGEGFDAVGDCCGECFEGIGDCCEGIGDCFGGDGCCGDCMGAIGDACGEIGEFIGSCFEACFDGIGDIFDAIGECC